VAASCLAVLLSSPKTPELPRATFSRSEVGRRTLRKREGASFSGDENRIGNCRGTSSALGGCINDANCMKYLLISRFGFRPENMRLLLDDNPDIRQHPTRQNMLEGFAWLVQESQPGDSLFFHYSGLQCSKFRCEMSMCASSLFVRAFTMVGLAWRVSTS